jgi:hypothetical protein
MPLVETLRPTLTAEDNSGGGYVLDGANAFDQNAATYSRVIAEQIEQRAAQFLYGFPADTYPTNRSAVVLKLNLARFGWTANDAAQIWFRPTTTSPFVLVDIYYLADIATVSTPKTVDVTGQAGAYPATGFEIAVVFLNDYTGPPTDPVHIGG